MPRLRVISRCLCRDRDEADDLVQQTVLSALAHFRTFRPGTNMEAWLITILKNRFRTNYRLSKRQTPFDPSRHAPKTAPVQIARLEYHALLQALDKLSAPQREALILVAMSNLSYAEVAEICGCELGTIKSRVNRARTQLAKLMDLNTAELGADGMTLAALHSDGLAL